MPDRSIPPKSKDEVKFRLPEFNSFSLDNGLVAYYTHKSELPVIRLTIIVFTGSKFDPQNQKGLSNLLSLCIDEGAGNLDALQISEELDLRGASVTIQTSNDITTFNLLVLSEYFEDTLKILADIIISPHLNQDDFERERRKVISRISQLKKDPEYITDTSFEFLLFGKENPYAYPTTGFSEDLSKLTVNNLKQIYSGSFSPGNSSLVVAGNIDGERLKNLVEKYFGSWKNSFKKYSFKYSTKETSNQLFIIDKKDAVQTEIRVGHLSSGRNQDEYFKKLLLNSVFGGQFTSRINLNLRERNGFTYGAYSAFNYFREMAFFFVSTSVGIENTFSALNEIFNELNGIRKGISKEEVQFAKSSIIKKFPSNFETYGQVVSNFINKLVYKLPDNYFETYIENINKVSLDDLNDAANDFIHPQKMITVLCGDKQKLSMQFTDDKFGQAEFMDYEELFTIDS